MKDIFYTNDLVKLSWVQALLADAQSLALGRDHTACVVLDVHTSVIEGSIGAIPRRLVVSDEDFERARQVMKDAGEEPSR